MNFPENNQQTQYEESHNKVEKKSNKLGKASLILGIISIISVFVFVVSIVIAIIGLILGIKSKVKNFESKAGIILNIISIVLNIILIVILILILDTNVYFGDGYNLEYDKNWSITTLSDETEVFKYKNEEAYLIIKEKKVLPNAKSYFNTSKDQEKLYQVFYDYLNNENSNEFKIFNGSNGFNKLTRDIYYATYTYGVSTTQIKGKYIILVHPSKDVVLSFMTSASENVENNDRNALELLKEILIYEQASTEEDNMLDDSEKYDDDVYDSLRNWNRYSELRTGELGKIKSINGGWRILNDSESYWKFENGQFWWYKSVNDLNDNYWYGTTQILTGKEGLKVAGIDENKLDTIVFNSKGNITVSDVYTIVCKPTKIISGGIDKSDTNIPAGGSWTYVWILVDNKEEGIEAQVLNMEDYEIRYYVKIAD